MLVLEFHLAGEGTTEWPVELQSGYASRRYIANRTGQALTVDKHGCVYNVGNWVQERKPLLIGTNGVVHHE